MKRLLIFSMVLLLAATVAAGCGSGGTVASSTTSPSIPAGWKVFEGDSVSLALPATFEGGKPTDADVAALVEQAVAFNPDLAAYTPKIDSGNVPLMMFGELDANGGMPLVVVTSEPMPSGISLEKSVDSLASEMASQMDTLGVDAEIATESVSKDEARLVISASLGGVQFAQLYVLHKAGSHLYSVLYQSGLFPKDTDPIFQASADTIVVKE